ncbi:MAG: flagellar biosynthesis anti-sigma factor FlgM [Bacillota bacterium]|nr:flagellar biosynthesis anti-sigma factor FlgM [Bacillota bacterium]
MKINGVTPNKVISIYSVNRKEAAKDTKKTEGDKIEISKLGKSLSDLALDGNFQLSDKRVEEIRNGISKGTYNVDSKQIAQKMINLIKGREV